MTTAVATLQKRNLASPDDVRNFPKGKVEIANFNGMIAGRGIFEPGWKWSECVKPIAGTESCQAPHFGYCLSGRMHVAMTDGTALEVGPGDAFFMPPGHDAWTVGDEPCVLLDFSGYENYAKPH